MRLTKIKKIIVWCLAVLITMGIIKHYFFPSEYKYGDWMIPLWWDKCQYNFCKYEVSDGYKFIAYREGPYGIIGIDKKGLTVYQKKSEKQLIILVSLLEYLKVNMPEIILDPSENKRTHRIEITPIRESYNKESFNIFNIVYFLPFFQRHDFSTTDKLLIKGITIGKNSTFETPKTKIKYFSGSFRQIGFYKGEKGLFRYPVPVFDFKQPSQGALAVINDKATGKTLFAIGVVPANLPFNEEEFLTVVKSLTSDAEPFELPEALKKLPVVRTVK